MNHFGIDIPSDEQLGCVGMGDFPDDGDGYVETYWD